MNFIDRFVIFVWKLNEFMCLKLDIDIRFYLFISKELFIKVISSEKKVFLHTLHNKTQ